MTNRKWYTPSGALAHLFFYMAKRSKETRNKILCAVLYGMVDIHGIEQALVITLAARKEYNEQRKKQATGTTSTDTASTASTSTDRKNRPMPRR